LPMPGSPTMRCAGVVLSEMVLRTASRPRTSLSSVTSPLKQGERPKYHRPAAFVRPRLHSCFLRLQGA
jgi:hypothetical protein